MSAAMARQKGDLFACQLSDHIRIGRLPPRCVEGQLLLRFKARHGVQTAAADNSNTWFHACMSSSKTPPVDDGWTKTYRWPPAPGRGSFSKRAPLDLRRATALARSGTLMAT